MEKSKSDYADILSVLLTRDPRKHERAMARLEELRREKDFVDRLIAAIQASRDKDRVVDALIDVFLRSAMFPKLWLALVPVCGPRQLGRLASCVGMISALMEGDARPALKKAVGNMKPDDRLIAIECLAASEPDKPDGWGDWLVQLASAQTRSTYALVTVAWHGGHWLSELQWSFVIEALVGKRKLKPKYVMMLLDGIRRTLRRPVVQPEPPAPRVQPFDLAAVDWRSLFGFLLAYRQIDAIQFLLASGPASDVPAGLLAVIEKALDVGYWDRITLDAGGHADVQVPLSLVQYLDIARFATLLACSLAVKRSATLAKLVKAVASYPVPLDEELVSMILALSECGQAVDGQVCASLMEDARRLDPPQQARAALGLVRLWRLQQRVPMEVVTELLQWLPKDSVDARLETWCCVLAVGDQPATPEMWSAALACAQVATQRGRVAPFINIVLTSLDAQDAAEQAPQAVVAATLELADRHQCLPDAFRLLSSRQNASQELLALVDPKLDKLMAGDDTASILDTLLWLAQADPDRWTRHESVLAKAVMRPGGLALLLRLVTQLYVKRIGRAAVWSVVVKWVGQMHGSDQDVAQAAVGLVLCSATEDGPDHAWCEFHLPPAWAGGGLDRMIRLRHADDWLRVLARIEASSKTVSAIWLEALIGLMRHGQWLLPTLEPVASAQKNLCKAHPGVEWSCVFLGSAAPGGAVLRQRICTEPELGDAFEQWMKTLGGFLRMLVTHGKFDQASARVHVLPLLAALGRNRVQYKDADPVAPPILAPVFGTPAAPSVVRSALLDYLLATDRRSERRKFSPQLGAHIDALIKLAEAAGVDDSCVKAFGQAHAALTALIDGEHFAQQLEHFQFLGIDLLDRSDFGSMFMYDDICGAINLKKWASNVLNVLGGPHLVVVVRDETGAVAAVAGCPLVQVEGRPTLSLLCQGVQWHPDFGFSRDAAAAPRFRIVGDAIVATLKSVARLITIDQVLVDEYCYFASAAWPRQRQKFVYLNYSHLWGPIVRLSGDLWQIDEPMTQKLAELPLPPPDRSDL